MNLLAPEVRGPVSVCSQQVRVRGHIAGARVTVQVDGDDVASKLSHWSDDVVDLGTSLAPGQQITARQEYDGMESPPSPVAVVVQAAPASLSALTIATHLHECGTAVWADGALPGAEITARIDGQVVGSGRSVDGSARLTYAPGLGPGQSLALEQTTCNGLSHTTASAVAQPLPDPLPMPLIHEPLVECTTAFRISNIVDGATVSIVRDGVEASAVAFDRSSLTFYGLAPLKAGELIEVRQSFTCREGSVRIRPPFRRPRRTRGDATGATHTSTAAATFVQPADNLPKPVVLGPVCPHPFMITITNLVPSARVILYVDGEPVAMSDADGTTASFGHGGLPSGSSVTARLHLCGKDGPLSDPVEVAADRATGWFGVSRMFECAAVIFIRDDNRETYGKIVYARDQHGNIISPYHQVTNSMYHLPVSPALSGGDRITIVVRRCGGVTDEFGPFDVHPLPDPLPPPLILEPVSEADPVVWVRSRLAGALLRVMVDGVFRGHAISRGDEFDTPVLIPPPLLAVGQEVMATKSMCAKLTRSVPVIVKVPPPMPPQLITPAHQQTGVPTEPTEFAWSDPGASTSAAADSFTIVILRNGEQVAGTTQPGTAFAVDLPRSTLFTWHVIAENGTGSAKSATFGFLTEAGDQPAPEPPPPPTGNPLLRVTAPFASYDKYTIQNYPDAHRKLYLVAYVGNDGTATSEAFELLLEWDGASAGGHHWTVLNGPALAPGEIKHLTHELPNGLPPGEWYLHAQVFVNGTPIPPKQPRIVLVGFF
jgi:hypothetical protein